MKGELATSFASLCSRYWSGRDSTISPSDLKYVIGKYVPQFSGFGQQDSHELITFILDGLHEDLNRCVKKPIVQSIDGDGSNDEIVAMEAWRRHKARNDSIIVDLFCGQLRSELICPMCRKLTVVFDPYMSLSLPIQNPHLRTYHFSYVPADFNSDYEEFEIAISDVDKSDVKLEEKFGKRVVPFSLPSVKGSSFVIGMSDQTKANYFVLEIPDVNKKYIPCVPCQNYTEMYVGLQKQVLSAPILIEVDSFDISEEEIEQKCCEYFDFLLGDNPVRKQATSSMVTFKKSFAYSREKFGDSKKILVKPKVGSLGGTIGTITPHEKYPMIASEVFHLFFKPDIIEKSDFPLGTLLQHFSNVSASVSFYTKNRKVTLDECFKYFSTSETLDENNKWYCPNCKQFVCATKKMDIWNVPDILIIQLKRFKTTRKLDSDVNFPSNFNMSDYIRGPQNENKMIYRLYAVSEHMGGLGGGHYTAHALVSNRKFEEEGGKWYYFNDSTVHKAKESEAHSSNAYILFYERINDSKIDDE
ncbi:Clan CA, family C19, ubiquitin hydrolase-like cysteine peptidase [Histomonas meleagridis]|uniref:Clan CA, family C19, ubiquitin hydrolase-like cysteine peptidase n=1 Tax=Histomonas meleagridis TaxID=135588 RepID=UPI00355AC2D7|nr:Clan CA, family C19, ubiquitin hydrolase-like cysteine peptidase [Histomonas meleagridis]KAH0796960.1 Clan CA, family C19, ubiquitin hydrolase-like cysteine peptidase [Histomonas meleagridis]